MDPWIILPAILLLLLIILVVVGGVGVDSRRDTDADRKPFPAHKGVVLTFYVDDLHESIAYGITKRFLDMEMDLSLDDPKHKLYRRKGKKDYVSGCSSPHDITLVSVSGNKYHVDGKVLTFDTPERYYDHMYAAGYTIFGGYTSTVVIQTVKGWAADKEDVKVITLGSATEQLDENAQFYRLYPPYSQSRIWMPLFRLESLTVLYEPSQIVSEILANIEPHIPDFNAVDVSGMTPEEAAQQVPPEGNVLFLTGREKLMADYPEATYFALDFFNWLPIEFNHPIRAFQARIVGNQVFFTESQINYVNQVHSMVAIAELLAEGTDDNVIQSMFSLDCFNDRIAIETEEQVFLDPLQIWIPSYLVDDEPLVDYLQTVDPAIRQAVVTYIQFQRAIHNSPCEYVLFWDPLLLEALESLAIPEELLVSPPDQKTFWNR